MLILAPLWSLIDYSRRRGAQQIPLPIWFYWHAQNATAIDASRSDTTPFPLDQVTT